MGLCPFHNEKTPSFTANEAKGSYHCFGCGAHGDIIDFVKHQDGGSFVEAVKILASQANLPLPNDFYENKEDKDEKNDQKTLLTLLEAICNWFQAELAANTEAQKYLEIRGVTSEEILDFRIGWAPKHGLISYGVNLGYSLTLLEQAGLVAQREQDGTYYERFRERLIFPIINTKGSVIAFGGRTLGDGLPKYLNSPETSLFIKGKCLYVKPKTSKPSQQKLSPWVLAEGYFDVISLSRHYHSAAPLGTAVTEDQISLIWKYCPEPAVCFDGDAAGQKATLKLAIMALPMLKPGYSFSFVRLPFGHDPQSFLQNHSLQQFQKLIETRLPMAQYLWEHLFSRQLPPERYAAAVVQWKNWCETIKDFNIQKLYQQWFYKARKVLNTSYHTPTAPSALLHQKILMGILILNPHLIEKFQEELTMMTFPQPTIWLHIRDHLLSWDKENDIVTYITNHLGDHWKEQAAFVDRHIPKSQDELESYWLELFNAYQTQVYRKSEISSLTKDLFESPEVWERLKHLTQL